MKVFLGIDPGITGAVACIDENGNLIQVQDTPSIHVKKGSRNHHVYIESAMATLLQDLKDTQKIHIVAIENVHAMPVSGKVQCFNFGMGFGIWLGILAALRLPYERIEPAKWKKEMGLTADKQASIVKASQLFPLASLSRKKDDGRAEALLLAEFMRRKLTI